MDALRLFNTVRYLKPVQIYGRITHKLHRPKLRLDPAPPLRTWPRKWTKPVERPISLIGPTRVRFLNEEGDVCNAAHWNDQGRDKLWLYNLHYFDDLNAKTDSVRAVWQRALVSRWIDENPPGHGNGWEPYPVSLRIVNWIKWALSDTDIEKDYFENLAVQARWLEDRIEWHLLGNHLLANAKALIFAGIFFEGPEAERWLNAGIEIYHQQLSEQVLGDGGHFERSPMYHAIILEDLLDVLNSARACGIESPAIGVLPDLIQRMRAWLRAMSHPDGDISFFNDAAFGIAASCETLEAYATRMGLPESSQPEKPIAVLKDSGYVRVNIDDMNAFLDVAPVGPDYLPGHAHADTLSFELSLGHQRLIVNSGTSCYGNTDQRRLERSTASHSTVQIDGEDSSEVWDSFRVARRARILDLEVSNDTDPITVFASHDGYKRLSGRPIHRRRWRFADRQLIVRDTIEGSCREAVARFHLGMGVTATIDKDHRSGILEMCDGRKIRWRSSCSVRIDRSEWHPEFGVSVPISCLAVPLEGNLLETEFSW